jgi:hypothetical protein
VSRPAGAAPAGTPSPRPGRFFHAGAVRGPHRGWSRRDNAGRCRRRSVWCRRGCRPSRTALLVSRYPSSGSRRAGVRLPGRRGDRRRTGRGPGGSCGRRKSGAIGRRCHTSFFSAMYQPQQTDLEVTAEVPDSSPLRVGTRRALSFVVEQGVCGSSYTVLPALKPDAPAKRGSTTSFAGASGFKTDC